MKKSLTINAILDQPQLLQNMVEKLAYRRYDMGYGNEKMTAGNEALETSTTETYVSGAFVPGNTNEDFNIPFITSFLFTCIKGKDSVYKLEWGSSLS